MNNSSTHHDMLIVGAGFSGLLMLVHAEELGLNACALEAGSEIGGTWQWNRYPGARTDSESWYYCFSFSDEILQDWTWSERYASQSELKAYLNYVADNREIRRHIRLNTKVEKAEWDSAKSLWSVTTNEGFVLTCRYLVGAMGVLSEPYVPAIPGLDKFAGQRLVTGRWPHEEPDWSSQRVGIIGTGATGVQLVPAMAEKAKEVIVFQRTPNYVIPAHNHALSAETVAEIKRDYAEIWQRVQSHPYAMPLEIANRNGTDFSAEDQDVVFEDGWMRGGFRFMFETFDDVITNSETNMAAARFVQKKIRSIVKDPATADILCPKYAFGAKRPPAGHFYYEAFNLDNVHLVDVSRPGIDEVVAEGVIVNGKLHQCDTLILATGFDFGIGAYAAIPIQGEDGALLSEKFQDTPSTYLGTAVHGFPNFFMINGPLSPFANLTAVIEASGGFVRDCIRRAEQGKARQVQVTNEAEREWTNTVEEVGKFTVVREGERVPSWMTGTNIPNRTDGFRIFLGGFPAFADRCRAEVDAGFPSFEFEFEAVPQETV